MMDYETISHLLNHSPALLALRKAWVAFAVSFLYDVFKRKHEVSIPQERFLERLETTLEHINAALPLEKQLNDTASHFLDRWSREDSLVHVRLRDDGYVIQLTPHAERLIGWFEDMQQGTTLATESRLRTILTLLDDVVTHSTEDVETRLQQLYTKRDELDTEIKRIEQTGQIDPLSDLQVRERLDQITSMANQLLRDFSAVEERFREMAREIQQAQLNPNTRRGDILGNVLDADERLSESDEGKSFQAFYQLLVTPNQRTSFDSLLNTLFRMPRLLPFTQDNALLRYLTSHLLDSGDRVQQSNRRLADHLRRVIDTRYIEESQQVQRLTAEIKHLVSHLPLDVLAHEMTSSRQSFFILEGEPSVNLPLERPLFTPPEIVTTTYPPYHAPERIAPEILLELFKAVSIDEGRLHDRIERLLMTRTEVTLAEVVNSYPIQQGIAEVIGYVGIAHRTTFYSIDFHTEDIIPIAQRNGDNTRHIIVPRVIFRRPPKQETVE